MSEGGSASSFVGGGGAMGARIRAHDWSATSIGALSTWSPSLRIVVRLMLDTGHPMCIFWGVDGICLYNDAFGELIGPEHHPGSLGRPARDAWKETWNVLGPQISQVMEGGVATWHVDHLVPMTRHGRREDSYWTYSLSPIHDDLEAGGIGGVLSLSTETTQKMLTVRQLGAERDQLAQLFEQAPTFMALLHGPDHQFEFVNPAYLRLVGHRPVLGRSVATALPEAAAQGYVALLDRVFATGDAYVARGAQFTQEVSQGGPRLDRFVDFVYQPIKDGEGRVIGIFVEGADVTDRTLADAALRERDARLQLLDAIGEATRMATSPRDVMRQTTRLLGQHLGASRCVYADVESDGHTFTMRDEWTAPDYPTTAGERYSLSAFGPQAISGLQRGEPVVVGDVGVDGTAGGAVPGRMQVQALICCPLITPAGLRGLLFVHSGECRHWSMREVALVQAAAERSWAHVERVRASDALVASEARFREMAESLAMANRCKDEFLATLAHELRNPLAPIRNALELMKLAPDDAVTSGAARDIIGRQLVQMVRLIDDLLDVSRVSRGIVELRRSHVALAAVLRDAIDTSRPQIDQAGLRLTVGIPAEALVLHADPTRIVQVFANLLNNAAKFTPLGGHIEISATREPGGGVAVSVRDSGVGIPPAMLERIFDMFTQLDRSPTHTGGLGIGLTLVRRLVDMHGGTVEARSDGDGRGSEFLVRLPLAGEAGLEGRHAEAALPPSAARRRILVADDNVDAAESMSMMLTLAGHDTRTEYDGERALAAAQDFRPEVMVLDIGMPRLGGHALARRIRAEPWGRGVLLIAASGWGQADDKQRSRDAGFDHHLVKPVDIETLHALLRDTPG